ncbi:MAG: argininosuccinate lyase, partial [Armatimonadetes bacterium CG07_land_8_20_14_0_80_40_9]
MKIWEGRFEKKMDKLAEDFSRSFSFDKRLFKYEIRQSIAQIMMLKGCKVIPAKDANKVIQGLKEILREGAERLNKNSEDIHTAIENRLIKKIGKIGGALPTARSRNDQVVTDLRMYLKEEIEKIENKILGLQEVFLNLAEENIDIIMPGFTHFQPAQPVLLSHYLLAYFNMFQRDLERYIESYKRCDVLPLGSGALAGVTFPIDREYLAKELGFSKTSSNSIDAVGERDFVIEFISTSSILMMHLSRLCEELVIFSTNR